MGLAAFCPLCSQAESPFIAIDFRSAEDGIVESESGNYALHLGDKAKILPNGPTGKPYLQFEEAGEANVRINPRQARSKLKGDEVSASFWFRLDRNAKSTIAYGFTTKGNPPERGSANYGMNRLNFNVKLEPSDFGTYSLWSRFEGDLQPGIWHHVAFTYSMSKLHFTMWYDGVIQRDITTEQDIPKPIKDFLTCPMAKNFPGAIADIRIWDTVVPETELLSMDVSPAAAKKMAGAFTQTAKKLPALSALTSPFRNWCLEKARDVQKLNAAKRADIREWMKLQKQSLQLPYLEKRATELASSRAKGSGSLSGFPGLPLTIYPYDMAKRLPYLLPYDGKADGKVSFEGAQGEFESRSFMVYPFRDVVKFHFTPTDLMGPGGAKIPASAIDIRTVKCWFTPGSGWNSYFGGGREFGTLSPELLVYDDAFIKVDREKRQNYIRCTYPTGPRYIWTSEFGTAESMEPFDYNLEPIHDAKTFRPLPLAESELKQFWLTAHIPETAKPGRYQGTLRFTADGKECGTMPVSLEVRPFRLPRAATRYNIDRPFFGTWINHINLDLKLTSGNYSNAVRRLYAEYKNMAEHNMLNPWTMAYGNPTYPDFASVQIDLMQKAGLETRPLFGDVPGDDMEWTGLPETGGDRDFSVEANFDFFKQRQAAFSNQVHKALAQVEKKLGHRDVFFYGSDEAGPGTVRREMPFFMIVRLLGGTPFITSGHARWAAFAIGMDDSPASFGRTQARNWHEGGSMVCTYAAPFSGPENPETWRRNKGIRIYTSNYDGCNEYVWYEGLNVWNDFAFSSSYKPFCIVYPTADGVVDTIAWEALREAFDDVRYLTLMRRLARVAIRSNVRELVRMGKTATAWAEVIDPESVDMDVMRSTAADWIVRLRNALAAKGVAVPDSIYR